MKLIVKDNMTGGDLLLFHQETGFDRLYFSRDRSNKYFTIAWNPGESQKVTIDGKESDFPSNALLTLLFDQSFHFEKQKRSSPGNSTESSIASLTTTVK